MSVTILEALENANCNLDNISTLGIALSLAKNQLNNAIILLKKGYGLDELVEPLLEKYGIAEHVPDKEEA